MSFLDKYRTARNLRNRSGPRKRPEGKIEILVCTPDDRFFSSLLYITSQYGWTVQWAKSTGRALEILETRAISILIYDWYFPLADWPSGVARFARVSDDICIVVAARQVDQDIWDRAIQCGAYDVMRRSGHAAELAPTLRFAWRWNAGRLLRATPAETCIPCPAPHSRIWPERTSPTWNSTV
jgi:DNA-binding response OmpR family regulator